MSDPVTPAEVADMPEFYEYVHKYIESNHSGVWIHVNRLDPQFGLDQHQMTDSIIRLGEFAAYSITAYRAIEWWAHQRVLPGYWYVFVGDDIYRLLVEILNGIKKPIEYVEAIARMVAIE